MKNENAIMDRIKARIAYHANEHRHTYEIGKGVMDFLARDLLADFKAAGGLFPPVALDGDIYVIYRRKPAKARFAERTQINRIVLQRSTKTMY